MIPEGNVQSNVDRFSGFEDDYDRYRPAAPQQVAEILTAYLGTRPRLVADLGCGTGLSTFLWANQAERVIGIEPNDDMHGKAVKKLSHDHADASGTVSFRAGYSNQLDLESGSADLVTCSQSFHWMEPVSTLLEASRVLTEGGIFACYDCDWPPTFNWTLEEAYNRLIDKADAILAKLVDEGRRAKKWSKEGHLRQIRESGRFRFTKEIVFHNKEACDAERFVGLALSQGGLQSVLKTGSTALDADIQAFTSQAEQYFAGRTLDILFSYRMRLGVK
ncbi:class I SAM-dependent methyltransferase [Paenibacillus filicis]|uniref:Class I SAM-dependent methyltransferase n=1 Tax=Paenibacillus gyeongsangnamensis TaxID=3388067 RepID=A0ABT4QC50_9BACL|nr:class I SAM-dependent methyltransferase [Paenibacillus filicis]MCZ8514463.1 class I SAM-dependent methyltransferase [Paenibacillus filicis]